MTGAQHTPDQKDKPVQEVYHHDDQDNPVGHSSHDADVLSESRMAAYWHANLKFLGVLLVIWFTVSFGAGIIFVDALDAYTFLGFPLGFWFAQQGAIYIFVVLIFVYVVGMQRIDKFFGVEDDESFGVIDDDETPTVTRDPS
ncbi:MAG: DUF4212 domain-containing protein [Rhodospirillaceae bacterium]